MQMSCCCCWASPAAEVWESHYLLILKSPTTGHGERGRPFLFWGIRKKIHREWTREKYCQLITRDQTLLCVWLQQLLKKFVQRYEWRAAAARYNDTHVPLVLFIRRWSPPPPMCVWWRRQNTHVTFWDRMFASLNSTLLFSNFYSQVDGRFWFNNKFLKKFEKKKWRVIFWKIQ